MALSRHNLVHRTNALGYKGMTGDGHLKLTNDQGYTTGYADIYKISGHDLSNQSNSSINFILRSFGDFLKHTEQYSEIISMPIPNNSHKQKTYWNHGCMEQLYHQIKNNDAVSKQTRVRFNDIADILKKQKIMDINAVNRQFFLVIFSKDDSKLSQVPTSPLFNQFLQPISTKNKLVLLSYLNFNVKAGLELQNASKRPYPYTNVNIGNIYLDSVNKLNFYTSFIKVGHYYIAFLNFKHFNHSGYIPIFWLTKIMSMAHTMSFLSIDNKDGITPLNIALSKVHLNEHALHKISLHILIYATSPKSLINLMKLIQKKNAYAITLSPILGRQSLKEAVKDIFRPVSEQNNTRLISFKNLVKAYPCHFSQLRDPHGEVFGITRTYGEFCFNQFPVKKDYWHPESRIHNFTMILGNAGMGKSTLANMLNMDAFDRGKYVYNLDISGEYRDFTKSSGGKIIDFSDSYHYINPLDLFYVYSQTKFGDTTKNITQFYHNLDRIVMIISTLDHYLTPLDLFYLKKLLPIFYNTYCTYPAGQFPLLSDLLTFLKKKSKNIHDTKHAYILGALVSAVNSIIDKYGKYLNHHTNIGHLKNIKCVDFDFSKIRASALPVPISMIDVIDSLSLMTAKAASDTKKHYYFNIDNADYLLSYNKNAPLSYLKLASLYRLLGILRKSNSSLTLTICNLDNMVLKALNDNQQYYIDYLSAITNSIQYWHIFNLSNTDAISLNFIISYQSASSLGSRLKNITNLLKYHVLTLFPDELMPEGCIYQWSVQPTDYQMRRFLNK